MAEAGQADRSADGRRGGEGAGAFSGHEFLLAFRYLRAKRRQGGVTLISIIAVVGVTLAIAALIAVMSVMNGFRHELLSRLLGVQPHVYVYAADRDVEGVDALVEAIRAVPGVVQAGPVVTGQAFASTGRGGLGVQVIGVRPDNLAQFDLIAGGGEAADAGGGVIAGDMAGFGAGRNGGDRVVIGSGIAEQLGLQPDDRITLLSPDGSATPLGMRPRQKAYTVQAVFSAGVLDLDRVLVFMPFDQAALFFNRPARGDYVDVRLATPSEPEAAVAQIRALAGDGAVVFDWRRQNQQFWTALQVERTAMRLILSIIVLIAAMNIISGIVMLVKNKGRDIAILRTMGATQGSVMRVFLIAGATLGVIGTALGLTLGVLIVVFIGPVQDAVNFITGVNVFDPDIYQLYRLPARLDWGEVAFVAAWGFITAVAATLPPAWRAGRLDPVEALRNE